MTSRQVDLDQWIDALAPVLRLDVAADARAGIKANLKTAAKMAAVLERVALREDAETAPIYRA